MMRAFGLKRRLAVGFALAWGVLGGPSWAGTDSSPTRSRIIEGYRLFLTDWSKEKRPGLPGDGLGPVFNEKSCVACHNLGGPGGAGGSRFDVMVLSDTGSPRNRDGSMEMPGSVNPFRPLASKVLPGFAAAPSLILHRFSNDSDHEKWRTKTLQTLGVVERGAPPARDCQFLVQASYRNTPALFGAGLIDAIPESVIEEGSRREYSAFPKVKGRPAYHEDGRIGRFGWKGQTASLGDFVRTACANELGLENPGHAQAADPLRPKYKAPGIDLTEDECASMTAFVASLPRPVEPIRPAFLRAVQLNQGRLIFDEIGCATCHTPQLGDVAGIYSDLLLHDMGQNLSDVGASYGATSLPGLAFDSPKGPEWRTPPLWGLRDSAPYLHDGRARTISEAVALHGGQAESSAGIYKKLEGERRGYLLEFLNSLTARPQADVARKSRVR